MTTTDATALATMIGRINGVEWARAYGTRIVVRLAGCGRVRKGAQVSIESDGSIRLPDSAVVCSAYESEIAAIRAVVA